MKGSRRGVNEAENAAFALSPTQRNAITNAGGIQTSLNTVASVPGGAAEVARTAQALRTTSGIIPSGVSPQALTAVKKLGGVTNTINVLLGLNTLSQKPATLRRKRKKTKTVRRRKPMKIRVAELNRVISSVKKQKLISLVAHNVTKTHNIHPNDEKKKKYYKKIIKSNILKTKFSKIVKKASRKK